MNLIQRYNKLNIWKKIAFWGSLASIISLAFFLILRNNPNVETQGNYSPGTVNGDYHAGDSVAGDKIINYGTIIKQEIAKTDQRNIVTDSFVKDFFIRCQLSLTEQRKSIPKEKLNSLPGYIQRPYDMNITISKTHGLGYEFITPSDDPQINIITTDLPIEEHYFSKYTNKKDFSKATVFRISNRSFIIKNFIFIASQKMIVLKQNANVLLTNVGLKYAKEDSTKEIEFLRLFANNHKDFWTQMKPEDEAFFLLNSN